MRNKTTAKANKLKKDPVLRIIHWLGMIKWITTDQELARPMLWRIHPLTWLYLPSFFMYSVIMHGLLETVMDLKTSWEEDTIW